MKLEAFYEKNKKKTGIIVGICSIVLLLGIVFVYRTYSLFSEKQEFNVIKGQVPDQNYDILFAFTLEEEGSKSSIANVPEGKDYEVTVTCNNEAVGKWDYEVWGPVITNLSQTRTKCTINFVPVSGLTLKKFGIQEAVVTTGEGIYEVSHEDAEITYTTDEAAINNLKMTEYRYAGSNPNNYVTFNNELWRIIGLVNTPEGQRIKLIRNESVGNYSWDTSATAVNNGSGVNEWSQADLMLLLNNGAYYNRTSGTCYNGRNNATVSCNFSSTGLSEEAKSMIDTITWNIGSNGNVAYNAINSIQFYNLERSRNVGKICSGGTECSDTVIRTTTWNGRVGLIYPSDYGYATSGGSTTDRVSCLNKQMYGWYTVTDCSLNDWLYNSSLSQWTLTPFASDYAYGIFSVTDNLGYVNTNGTVDAYFVRPAIYLNVSVGIVDGSGMQSNPYTLNL